MPGPLTFSRRAQKLMYLLLVTLVDNVFVLNEDIKKPPLDLVHFRSWSGLLWCFREDVFRFVVNRINTKDEQAFVLRHKTSKHIETTLIFKSSRTRKNKMHLKNFFGYLLCTETCVKCLQHKLHALSLYFQLGLPSFLRTIPEGLCLIFKVHFYLFFFLR